MKFSGKMRIMIILKVTKNQGFPLCLKDKSFEKPQGRAQIDPPADLEFRKMGFFFLLYFCPNGVGVTICSGISILNL